MWPLRRETSQRRQPEVNLTVISHPLAVADVNRRRILSSLMSLHCALVRDQMTPLQLFRCRSQERLLPFFETALYVNE